MKEIKSLVVDPKTGEIETTINDGDRIVRKRSTDLLNETVSFNQSEYFAKIYTNVLPEVIAELSPQECKLLLALVQYLRKDSGVLKQKNGRPITVEGISRTSKIGKRTVERAIAGLKEKDIIQSVKRPQGRYLLLNPYVIMNGRRIDKTSLDIFYKSRWANRK